MAVTKIEVGTILPKTTKLKVIMYAEYADYWPYLVACPVVGTVFKTTDSYLIVKSGWIGGIFQGEPFVYREIDGVRSDMVGGANYSTCGIDNNLNCNTSNIFTLDTSTWTLEQRTVTQVYQDLSNFGIEMQYEDTEGYTIQFVTNGGTSVTKLEDVEELPTPLPTTTKANNIFVGWFYDNGFEVKAFSGDAISSNITLYAKWYANMSDFYQDVADAIRSKNGETEPIKHTDFAYKIKNILDDIETALDAILGV